MWMVTTDDRGLVKYWQSNFNNVHTFQAHADPVKCSRWECSCSHETRRLVRGVRCNTYIRYSMMVQIITAQQMFVERDKIKLISINIIYRYLLVNILSEGNLPVTYFHVVNFS